MNKVPLIFTLVALLAVACKDEPKKTSSHAAAVVFVAGNDAKVINAKGKAKLAKGMVLHESDTIETGAKTQVDLLLPNNIFVRIDHNTTVQMQDFGLAAGGIQTDRLMLQRGSVFAKVAKLDKNSTFMIKTPTIVAGVRGTQFMTEVGPNGQGKVAVTEGKVAVESVKTGKVEEVKQGEQIQVSETGSLAESKIDAATAAKTSALSSVSEIKAQDLQKFQNILGDQQKLLDQSNGTDKVKGMMDGNTNRVDEQKGKSQEKVDGLKGQTDTKVQGMKAAQETKVQENQQKIDQANIDAQKKIDEMKNNSAIEEAKKKQEDMFKKFP